MTKIFKTIAILAASLGMVACSTNEPIDNPTLPEQDGLVEVNLYAENHLDQSRVSITETEESIICAWEATDQIGVFAQNYNGTEYKNSSSRNNLPFTYDATNNYFSGTIPSTSALGWRYTAYYPYSNLNGTNSSALVPFPAERVQYGNEYPCAYDIMSLTAALETTDTEVGKQDGSPIIFNLERRTAIAYFHFTATDSWAATEKVEAITISSDNYLGRANLKYKRDDNTASFDGDRYTSITINYGESNKPYAADFKAYFHLMPGTVENLVITIYTENHTATYTATSKTYEAGKLYRSNLAIASTKWESRIVEALTAPTINEEVVVAYNSATFSWEAVEGAVGYTYKFGEDGEETTVEATSVTLEDLTYSTDYNYTLYVKALGDGIENSDSEWASQAFDFATGEAPAAGEEPKEFAMTPSKQCGSATSDSNTKAMTAVATWTQDGISFEGWIGASNEKFLLIKPKDMAAGLTETYFTNTTSFGKITSIVITYTDGAGNATMYELVGGVKQAVESTNVDKVYTYTFSNTNDGIFYLSNTTATNVKFSSIVVNYI